MLRKLKDQKGFTLVEVIVVAVIVLILAAVAIPLYNGYIRDSRVNVASNIAGSIASAFGAAVQQETYAGVAIVDATDDATGTVTVPAATAGAPANVITIPKGFYPITVDAANNTVTVGYKNQFTGETYKFAN